MSTHSPLISICIPAYSRQLFLQRLLESIELQHFRDFEVIITDDSPADVIEQFLKNKLYNFPIQYIRNQTPLGTPVNWTEGMKYAKGKWIKVMHDDDWFSNPDSLATYAGAIKDTVDCIFSGYTAFYEAGSKSINKTISTNQFSKLKSYPYYLFGNNVIGPPSVVLFRRDLQELYDPGLKWLVDLEAYVRMLKNCKCIYIAAPLIIMSYNDTQVTNECFRNPDIEVREALIYYRKNGEIVRKRLLAYDAWWRMIRNLEIRTEEQLNYFSKGESVPDFLWRILNFQKRIPLAVLNKGVFSKLLMFTSYLLNR